MSLVHAPTPFSIAVGVVMTFLDLWLRHRSNRAHMSPPLALVQPSPDRSRRRRRLIPHGYDFFGPGPLAA